MCDDDIKHWKVIFFTVSDFASTTDTNINNVIFVGNEHVTRMLVTRQFDEVETNESDTC